MSAGRDIAGMVREVASAGCDAVAIVCTNMRAAGLAKALEAELDVPVYDSIATTVWMSLLLAGVAPERVRDWGSLFALAPAPTGAEYADIRLGL